jgi:hypothetical protein
MGLRAPTNEVAHCVALKSQKRGRTTRSLLAGWQALPRELNAALINCGSVERRFDDGRAVASHYPRPFDVTD